MSIQHTSAQSARNENHSFAAGENSRLRQVLLPAATGAVVLLASLLNYLNHNSYPVLSPEVGLVAAGLIMLAVCVAAVYVASGKVSRTLLEFLLVYVALDLNFDGIGVFLGAAGAVLILRRALLPAICVMFTVILLSQIAGFGLGNQDVQARPSPSATARSDAPALLHLILDEHIGIEGLPEELPQSAAIRSELKGFYLRRGFRLWGGAYSEYMASTNSIPHILNFGDEQPWLPEHRRDGLSLQSNAYFDRLEALGYQTYVYQSDHVRYCESKSVRSCTEYSVTDLLPIANSSLRVDEKASIVTYGLLSLSSLAVNLGVLYDASAILLSRQGIDLPFLAINANKRTSTLSALAALDQLIPDLRDAKPGEAYFAHILLPHDPYIMNAECKVKSRAEWIVRKSFEATWEDRQLAYFDQLRCAMAKVDEALEALAGSPAGKNSVVVIHGDHGSRITQRELVVENAERGFKDVDLIGTYSTLFAARATAIDPGYDNDRRPVASLLTRLARSGFGERYADPESKSAPGIMIENRDWKPVRRHPLPRAWLSTEPAQAVLPGSR